MNDSNLRSVSTDFRDGPFGMTLEGRIWSLGSEYRYGFNGMELDNEINGINNSLDFGARIYDARLGRFFSTDNYDKRYLSWATYSAFLDNPIYLVDKTGNGAEVSIQTLPDGRTVILVTADIYIYSDVASIQSNLTDWATQIQTDLNSKLNSTGAVGVTQAQPGIDPNTLPIVFDIKVNAVAGGGPAEAQAKMDELAASGDLTSAVNFIHLNDVNDFHTVGSVIGRSNSNVGTWSVLATRDPNHWVHEFAHLVLWRVPNTDPTDGDKYDTHGNEVNSVMYVAGPYSLPTVTDVAHLNFDAGLGSTPTCDCPNTIKMGFVATWSNGVNQDYFRWIMTKYIGQTNVNLIFQDVNQAVMLIDAMPADTDTKPITSPPATDK